MRSLLLPIVALIALTACQPKGGEKPSVKDAWVRLSAVPGRPAAGYFTLKGAAGDDRLLRIDSAVVKTIEMHESVVNGGVMTMRKLTELPLPAGATVAFAPSGNHAMLFDVDPRITPGTAIPMLFSFAGGARIEVEAKTVPAGAEDPSGAMSDMRH